MITSVRLKNYKAHRDTELELGRFTVLVGPNGAGKTSVLEALQKFDRVARHGRDEALVFGSEGHMPTQYFKGGSGPMELTVEVDDRRGGAASKAGVTWEPQHSWVHHPLRPMGAVLGEVTLYRFEARLIAAPSASQQETPFLFPDGANTADVLAALKLADDPVLLRIEETLRAIVPAVHRTRIRRRIGASGSIGQQIVLDFAHADNVPADDVSEGTLVTLALVTAICSGPRPHTLLLDDLGLSLHPTAQMELVRQIRRLLDEIPDIQIIATTHSPYVLDELPPEDVVVFALRKDGSVATKRLSEHPEAQKMKGVLGSGQLWTLDPEHRWIIGDE